MSQKSDANIAVMGGGAVGKSCLTIQFINRNFPDGYDPTIWDTFYTTVDLPTFGKKSVSVQDTAGQEEFQQLRSTWVKEAQAFIIVFSILEKERSTSLAGLDMLVKEIERGKDMQILPYKQRINKGDRVPFFPMILVGNKSDAATAEERQAAEKDACEFIQKHFFVTEGDGVTNPPTVSRKVALSYYIETSALKNQNVDNTFLTILDQLFTYESLRKKVTPQVSSGTKNGNKGILSLFSSASSTDDANEDIAKL